MGKYNPEKLKELRYGILGIYLTELQELRKGSVPNQIETHGNMLIEALPFFTKAERVKLKKVLNAGFSQTRYLTALQAVETLSDTEPSRIKIIDAFLAEMDE